MTTRQRHSTGKTARVTQPGQVNEKHVKIKRPDRYILTIGFEVNNDKAYTRQFTLPTPIELATKDGDYFSHNNQNLSEDYGHAFIYVTKNDIVMSSFSFGPAKSPESMKEAFGNRPGNTLYSVGEVAKLFRFQISKEQADKVKENVEQFTQKVASQQIHYAPYKNDTCAASAKEILDQSNIETPSGKSYASYEIKKVPVSSSPVLVVTPYEWYYELSQKYSNPEPIIFTNGVKIDPKEGYEVPVWVAKIKEIDPLSNQQRKIIHGILGQDQTFDMKELQDFSDVSPPVVPEIQPLDATQPASTSKK